MNESRNDGSSEVVQSKGISGDQQDDLETTQHVVHRVFGLPDVLTFGTKGGERSAATEEDE